MTPGSDTSAAGLLVALGVGLLVGIERERRKGRGPGRSAAGMRSFALVSLAGALAQSVGGEALVAAGAVAVALLAALSYWRTTGPRAPDPGLTTEIALFVTYLVGVQCAREPALGAACGAALAAVLAARENMHRFATEWLTEVELRDALVLASVALIVVPLSPTEPLPWLGGLSVRKAATLVLVILGIQAAAHVAQRLLDRRQALALSGLLGGFVSSTATIATFGAQCRSESQPAARSSLAGAAALSGTATWLQTLALCAVASPALWMNLLPPAAAGAAIATAGALGLQRHRAPDPTDECTTPARRPLRLREALIVAALLLTVVAVVTWARDRFGSGGLWAGTALAALADAHAPIAAILAMHGAGTLAMADALHAVLLATSVNTASRSVVAVIAGGWRYAIAIFAVLAASLAAAWLVLLWGLAP